MDSVQVGKAVFVKVSFASLGFEPRTFSYPGSCATNTLLAKKFACGHSPLYPSKVGFPWLSTIR